jgi:large subunit ribosomal protein L13
LIAFIEELTFQPMRTLSAKANEVQRRWWLIDAADQVLGRVAARAANILRGKEKAIFTPHMDAGDFVIVVNAEKVVLSGNKDEQKLYQHYTGFPGGLKKYKAAMVRARKPERIVRQAVWGMIPRTRQGRQVIRRLKIHVGGEHTHVAQQPQVLEIT